ncbi:unnamed protein product [Chironomus riparius]|uniref:Uncharacterized protein n=1 Tax=Chironomus riparius TaxID=315576 RepID=A0A9N9WLE7_9DIPT|nr:unnamed protein product [Chironomus riparius]
MERKKMGKKFLGFIVITWMISSSSAAQITCQFSGTNCNVVSTTAITRPNEVITVSGMPLNYVNTAVNSVIFKDLRSTYVPNGICKIFPNLGAISFNGCSITNLLKDSFLGCPNLVTIYMAGPNVPIIPAGFTQSNLKLINFVVMYADTIKVERNALIGLTNLQQLIMSNNKITCLPYDIFQSKPNLVSIDFSNNKIAALDQKLFNNLPTLMTANFKYNLIATLPNFELLNTGSSYLVTTLQMDFDYNQIRSINPNICTIIATRLTNRKMTIINIGGSPCTLYNNDISQINPSACNEKRVLKVCYSNWTPTTYVPIQC